MKIVPSSTGIQIGENTYPLNTLFFKADLTIVYIFKVGNSTPIITAPYQVFININGEAYSSTSSVISDLKQSFVRS